MTDKPVKRYDCSLAYNDYVGEEGAIMELSLDGEYVKYSDYEALLNAAPTPPSTINIDVAEYERLKNYAERWNSLTE